MRVAPGLLRLKIYLSEEGTRVVIALLLVAVLAFGAAAFSVADPPRQTVIEDQHQQAVGMELEPNAVVTGDTGLYERGTRLHEMPVYLRSATPTLTPTLRTTVPAGTDVEITQRVWVNYTATRDGAVFWRDRQQLAATETRVSDGNATLEPELHISQVYDRLQESETNVENIGQVSVTLHGQVEYDTGRYEGNLSDSTSLQITDRAYWLGGDVAAENTHTTTVEQQRVDRERATVTTLPGIGTLVVPHIGLLWGMVGVLCLGGAVRVRRFHRQGVDQARLRETLTRERFDEWISRGRVPEDTGQRSVYVESLEDLVDVAIDSSKRVIRDPERELYVVIDGDVVYRYRQGEQFGPFIPKSPKENEE